jgi:ABC-type transporter Mla subunit MlaD
MTNDTLFTLLSDGLLLLFLAATVFYAARLSLYLKRFRDNKADLEAVIKDLSNQIEKADAAIKGLNVSVKESSDELRARMSNASEMSDELQLMIESGDSMANRLESLAVKNRKILEGDTSDLEELRGMTADKDPYDQRVQDIVRDTQTITSLNDAEKPKSVFNIRDMDVERGEDTDEGFTIDDNDDVLSDAERDLYNTLKERNAK